MSEDAGDDQGYVSTELFGGAMVVDMPVGFGDVSNLRPVPSHQEIYLSNTGFTSVAIDITERVSTITTAGAGAGAAGAAAEEEEASDRDALKFHFEDIVNTGDESRIWDIEEQSPEDRRQGHFEPSTPILTLKATTTTPSSSSPPTTTTIIIFTLIRLVPQSTDLIITINVPLHPAALSSFSSSSSSSTSASAAFSAASISKAPSDDAVQAGLIRQGEKIAARVVASLRVRDWGLFGGM